MKIRYRKQIRKIGNIVDTGLVTWSRALLGHGGPESFSGIFFGDWFIAVTARQRHTRKLPSLCGDNRSDYRVFPFFDRINRGPGRRSPGGATARS